jgi:sodium/proline symporter
MGMMLYADAAIAGTFVVYLLAMLGVGVIACLRTKDLSDYILGGRRLGSFVTALSAQASDMSGWLLLGLPGAAYVSGLGSVWIAVGLLAGTYLNWLLVAPRLRVQTAEANDSLTISSYLENRFDDRSHLLRWVSAIFILVFFLIYTTSGLVAGGKLFESVFHVDYRLAVLLGAAAIISYTCLGGFVAVCWTDCFQGMLMLLALVVVPVIVLESAGGWPGAMATVREINPELLTLLRDTSGKPLGIIAILSGLGWGLGYFGQPHILCRFMAIRDARAIPAARRIAMAWVSVSLVAAVVVGLVGIAAFADAPLEGADTEKVFIHLVRAFLHPVPAGICLAAILAAIMSTADSQLLVSSSVLVEDFYKGFLGRSATERGLVWIGRAAVVLIAVIASGLALDRDNMVLALVAYAWAGFGATFGPVLIMGLFWKGTTRNGALAGIVVGGVTVLVWGRVQGGIFDLYEIIPAMALSFLAIVLVSLAGKKRA